MKSGNNPYSKFFILLVLGTTMGYAQQSEKTQETTLKPKSDLSSAGAHTNPYFVSNEHQGDMMTVSGNNNSNQNTNQNENIPFSHKSSVSNVLKTKHDTAKNSVSNIR